LTYLIEKPEAPLEELMNFIQGPDFPTGGIIYGKNNILETYATGKGTIIAEQK